MEFPHKEQNGMLKYLHSIDPRYFNNSIIFSYVYSNFSPGHIASNAFDFDSDDYWIDDKNGGFDKVNFMSFCFKVHRIKLTGYEIKTSYGDSRPRKWSFSGSNNNKTWYKKKEAVHPMEKGETHYEDWNGGPYRCFRFDFLQNVASSGIHSDVKQIELFGTMYSLGDCLTLKYRMKSSLMTSVLFINMIFS